MCSQDLKILKPLALCCGNSNNVKIDVGFLYSITYSDIMCIFVTRLPIKNVIGV